MAGAHTCIRDAAHRTAAVGDITAVAKDGEADAAGDASSDVRLLQAWSARKLQVSMGLTAYLLPPPTLGGQDCLPL
jgi:hypothetical protein